MASFVDVLVWPFSALGGWARTLFSQEKKMRENAGNWLELADKVFHYRRDVLTDAQLAALQSHSIALRTLIRNSP